MGEVAAGCRCFVEIRFTRQDCPRPSCTRQVEPLTTDRAHHSRAPTARPDASPGWNPAHYPQVDPKTKRPDFSPRRHEDAKGERLCRGVLRSCDISRRLVFVASSCLRGENRDDAIGRMDLWVMDRVEPRVAQANKAPPRTRPITASWHSPQTKPRSRPERSSVFSCTVTQGGKAKRRCSAAMSRRAST